ncbi:tail fiber domain-containing protein [Candidatus Woesearchaeota archaeon]|nr:tail fiber domain-containing protein [Candidatus Woesearchaeota archaeon]
MKKTIFQLLVIIIIVNSSYVLGAGGTHTTDELTAPYIFTGNPLQVDLTEGGAGGDGRDAIVINASSGNTYASILLNKPHLLLWNTTRSGSRASLYAYGAGFTGRVGIGTDSPDTKFVVTDGGINTKIDSDGILTGGDIYVSSAGIVKLGDSAGVNKLTVYGGGASISSATAYSRTSVPSGGLIVQGNVGIGRPNPTDKLHVDGTVRFEDFTSCTALETNSSGGLVCGSDDSGSGYWSPSALGIYYNSGNVGIGETDPTEQLEVVGDARIIGNIAAGPLGGSVSSDYGLSVGGGDVASIVGHGGSNRFGVMGLQNSISDFAAIYGKSSQFSSIGIMGHATHSNGTNRGIYGVTESSSGIGVHGLANSTSGGRGVYGRAQGSSGTGVYGIVDSTSNSGTRYGGYFSATDGGASSTTYALYATGGDYGVYSEASGTYGFYTPDDLYVGGSASIDSTTFVVDAGNNRVGIRTASPQASLHIKNPAMTEYAIRIEEYSGSEYIEIGVDSEGDLNFYDEGSNTVTIQDNTGNLGVGAAAPTHKLDVNGNASIDGSTFVVDSTNNRVGIGTSSPTSPLTVWGDVSLDADTLFVDSSANSVGIGTTSPQRQLHVEDAAAAKWIEILDPDTSSGWASQLRWIADDGTTAEHLFYLDRDNNDRLHLLLGHGGSPDTTFQIHGGDVYLSSGNIISPVTYSTTVGATYRDLLVDNTGLFGYQSSTLRHKTKIEDLDNANWIYLLRPVTFEYKVDSNGRISEDGTAEGTRREGLIAEEVEKIHPSLVYYDEQHKVEGVNYKELIVPLLKEVQNHKEEISELKKQNEALKKIVCEAKPAAEMCR